MCALYRKYFVIIGNNEIPARYPIGLFACSCARSLYIFLKVGARWNTPESRGSNAFGGFAFGIDKLEIEEIAASFAPLNGTIHPIQGKSVETILINASYRKGFWEKIGTIVRDIAGSHLFNDANHRISFEVAKRLIDRNVIAGKISDEKLYQIISKAGRNAQGFQTAEEIAAAFRGY